MDAIRFGEATVFQPRIEGGRRQPISVNGSIWFGGTARTG
jgi:hypothetical protein